MLYALIVIYNTEYENSETIRASLYEVTKGKANYIEDPLDVNEWIEKMKKIKNCARIKESFPEYSLEYVIEQYFEVFQLVKKEKNSNTIVILVVYLGLDFTRVRLNSLYGSTYPIKN